MVDYTEKMEQVAEQGKRLRRRLDYLKRESDFLIGAIIARPTKDTASHRKLLEEWEKEIGELERSLQYLRGEYLRYKQLSEQTSKKKKV
ncbi:MAG: hypothetical protein ACI30I_06190 [Parabacteroides sp.]